MAYESVYYIPNGPKNLVALFPLIQFSELDRYYVEVLDTDENIVATSPINHVCNCGGNEKVRIHFLNRLGTYDALNFMKPKIVHEDTASEYQNALSEPLSKTDTGTERFNIVSNDTHEARLKCNEPDMPWLTECKDAPKAFMEWIGTEAQPDSYIPVVILAGKMETLKNDREFEYEFVLQYKLSNEYINIRN